MRAGRSICLWVATAAGIDRRIGESGQKSDPGSAIQALFTAFNLSKKSPVRPITEVVVGRELFGYFKKKEMGRSLKSVVGD